MSSLEHAINEWRQQMIAGGVRSPGVLNELESHLREDTEQQVQAGLDSREAFASAVQRIGPVELLKNEFEKVGTRQARQQVKRFILTLAGVPNQFADGSMSASFPQTEPWWATYFKSAISVTPGVFLWILSAVFIIPKVVMICDQAGMASTGAFWDVTRASIGTTVFFIQHGMLIACGLGVVLGLLEWRSSQWRLWRRGVLGLGAFLLNSVVLFSIFIMFLAMTVAAPGLMHPSQ